ncbi:hypothetical protein ACH4SK_39105, partial [Streptomyces inhibens]
MLLRIGHDERRAPGAAVQQLPLDAEVLAQPLQNREAGALTLLAETDVPAPGLVAVDPTAAHCEYPSLLMTHLAGRTVLDDEGLETRVPLLAR